MAEFLAGPGSGARILGIAVEAAHGQMIVAAPHLGMVRGVIGIHTIIQGPRGTGTTGGGTSLIQTTRTSMSENESRRYRHFLHLVCHC